MNVNASIVVPVYNEINLIDNFVKASINLQPHQRGNLV